MHRVPACGRMVQCQVRCHLFPRWQFKEQILVKLRRKPLESMVTSCLHDVSPWKPIGVDSEILSDRRPRLVNHATSL